MENYIHPYASLHNHTDYSNLKLIDCINKIPNLIDRAYELGIKGIAITDHDTLSGHIVAMQYMKEKYKEVEDFKLILGNEIYISRENLTSKTHEPGEKFYHCILLAKDEIGHEQLRKLSSRAWGRSYIRAIRRTPTYISDLKEIVGEKPGHLVCTTACLGSLPGSVFLTGDPGFEKKIEEYNNTMFELFGEDFFIEIQPGRQQDQIDYNKYMITTYYNKYPFVVTTDAHYLRAEERGLHRDFLRSKPGSENREVDAFYGYTYEMSSAEIYDLVKDYISLKTMNEMFDNTIKITEKIETYDLGHTQLVPKIKYEWDNCDLVSFEKLKLEIKQYNIKNKYEVVNFYFSEKAEEADRYLAMQIAKGYYSGKIIPSEEYITRLNEELYHIHSISKKLGQPLSDYFNTMSKIIDIVWTAGDSLVGVGRGSGAGSLINYLIGITQLDPLRQELVMPFWRFMHESRPELPDIDFDTEAGKRLKIFNAVKAYFNSINSEVINVSTFTTLGTKSAIKLAGKGLGINDTVLNFLASTVPSERGKDWTLTQCMNGDELHKKIPGFVAGMREHKNLWLLASRIEGLITNLGVHASGVLVLNGKITDHNSVMKTSSNVTVTAWELHNSEYCGGLKYDFLTIAALDKIRTCLNLLLEDRKIEWKGNLKDTYEHYLLPANLEYNNKKKWDLLNTGKILECFQFDTTVGSKAIRVIQPTSLKDLAAGNSIMRLMSEDTEQPLDIYVRHKRNMKEWYAEMDEANLNKAEQSLMESYLKNVYGVAGSQELVMMLSMDKHIANFTIVEANKLRKGIAKKKPEIIEAIKKTFFEKGLEVGTREELLDYVWNRQISMSLGYSFSDLHTTAYSTIALQEVTLAYDYPIIYWNCACLSVDADAVDSADYNFLLENEIIEEDSEDDLDSKKKSSKVSYDKVASAISKFRDSIDIIPPDINKSKIGFTPDVENNAIIFGLKGISRVGNDVVAEIMMRRPFSGVDDFVGKMANNSKKLISVDRIVNLIKSGCFDRVEKLPREEIMNNFLMTQVTKRKKVDMKNAISLIKKGLIPKNDYQMENGSYLLGRYFGRHKDGNGFYIIGNKAQENWCEKYYPKKVYDLNGKKIKISEWNEFNNPNKIRLKEYVKENEKELADKLYKIEINEKREKYAKGDRLQWELDSLNFYQSGHPLENLDAIEYEDFNKIYAKDFDGFWNIGGRRILKYKLHTICGTVLIKDKRQSILVLSTPTGIVKVKLYKQQYAKYAQKIENDWGQVIQEPFTEKGTHLCVTGIKRDGLFIPKVYKSTRCPPIVKINLGEKNVFVDLEEKS